MVVCGKYCHILSRSGTNTTVLAFADDIGSMNVPIVDKVIVYDCLYSQKVYLLIVGNILFVESIIHNLIPPFILKESSMVVNERP